MSLSVSPAAPHELMSALRLLFGDAPAESADPRGLFVARDGPRVCGAILAQAMPGALGVIRPPRAEVPEAEDALVRAACEWLRAGGVKVCQAFAPADALLRNGFRHVTQLVFLRRAIDPDRDRMSPAEWLDGTRYHPELRERFVEALLATQAGTLDCPELDLARTPEEVVAGFDLPDGFSPWHFRAYIDGRAAGLTLTEPGGGGLELTYVGVVPDARGRGLGGRLLRRILHEAACAGFGTVELSVDVRNEPALRLYRRHGFAETDRREVLLVHLTSGPCPGGTGL